MSHLSIILKDVEGYVEAHIVKSDDFDPTSNASRIAAMIMNYLDTIMQKADEVEEV